MANVVSSSLILVILMMKVISSSEHRFLQEPHGVKSQKTPFFIVTAMKTSNLTDLPEALPCRHVITMSLSRLAFTDLFL
jgi:hypothetical protein